MKIKQASVANCLNFFKNGFLEKWGLEEYNNEHDPCFFLGVEQVDKINKHQGYKIIYIASEYDSTFLDYIVPSDNIIIHKSPFKERCRNFKVKDVELELKDYTMFKPNVLGDKVYSYIGTPDRSYEFDVDRLVSIKNKIDYELILGISDYVHNYQSITSLKENYYDKCFININLSNGTAMTTIRELGLMGRKTITNSTYNFPSQIPYVDDDDIIRIINEEAKKIGTIQPSMDCHTVKDEWLDINFWLK